ncbi:MAG: hypothetical protein ACUZ8N_03280 [Candidatus Scalindua sp.]
MGKLKKDGLMNQITKQAMRDIVDDFADDIYQKKRKGAKPSFEVIYFRSEHMLNIEREVFEVPTELLRFRKDNGRIASDVMSHEKDQDPLTEKNEEAQNILKDFLDRKDPEKTNELINSIKHSGQREAAIITADGFLINGNRRKVALEKLFDETKHERFKWMKVVILPGKNEEGGPPTLIEIEQIENRYQLQSEGKAEYYNFDRALSIRRKIDLGMSLEEQLRDDPNFTKLLPKDFENIIKKYQDEYLEPLNCIDRYLDQLDRPGLYYTISTGISDRQGRWQAFLDYYNQIWKKLEDDYKRIKMGIKEDEVGDVEEIAFKIIRKREFPDMPKVHKIMRDLPKWLEKSEEAKKELFKLLDIDNELPKEKCYDKEGSEYDERKKDQIWNTLHQATLINQVKKARTLYEHKKERETPLTLLEAALKKLQHENMDPTTVNLTDMPKAMNLAKTVKDVADSLESEFYHLNKDYRKKAKKGFSK